MCIYMHAVNTKHVASSCQKTVLDSCVVSLFFAELCGFVGIDILYFGVL